MWLLWHTAQNVGELSCVSVVVFLVNYRRTFVSSRLNEFVILSHVKMSWQFRLFQLSYTRCGRISCQREGFDFCPFCGFLVERPPEGVSRTDQAWLHKERLLRFDRESAQRMIVIDDQSDYAATHQMAWLTQEETDEAEEKQAEREQNFRQRPTMQLDLAL